jgi:Fe2+ transport system protein FeoA
MCGCDFDPAANGACELCPLHGHCALVCCPACGYATVDPTRSLLVRLGSRLLARARAARRAEPPPREASLAEVAPGRRARVEALDELTTRRRHELQAYGLAPGRAIEVVQQLPVTLVRVEQVELALEREIARRIRIAPLDLQTIATDGAAAPASGPGGTA